jgi:hypothetical protein
MGPGRQRKTLDLLWTGVYSGYHVGDLDELQAVIMLDELHESVTHPRTWIRRVVGVRGIIIGEGAARYKGWAFSRLNKTGTMLSLVKRELAK